MATRKTSTRAYTFLTLDLFMKRLKTGHYKSAAGANRAIGKAEKMKPAEADKAKAAVARKKKW